jgi:hypothetical protein
MKLQMMTLILLGIFATAGCGKTNSSGGVAAGVGSGAPAPGVAVVSGDQTEENVLPQILQNQGGIPVPGTVQTSSATYVEYLSPNGIPYCQKEGEEPTITFTFSSPTGSGKRDAQGGKVRAKTEGPRAEVEYFGNQERLSLNIADDGKISVSGQLQVAEDHPGDRPIVIDSKKQKCQAKRRNATDNSKDITIEFSCDDGTLNIQGEVLVPQFNQSNSIRRTHKYRITPTF